MEEKKEKRQEHRKNALTIGIGNPDTADRFLAMKTKTYAATYEEIVKLLLDAYDSSGVGTDNSEELSKLQQRIEELEQDNLGYRSEEDNYKHQIGDLQAKLEAAIADANANAESGLGRQLQLDELQQHIDGAIILKPNPVVAHFLNEMAAKTGSTPERILEELFLADLQNPRSNNLPYTVSPSKIREVMEELREPEKPKENE